VRQYSHRLTVRCASPIFIPIAYYLGFTNRKRKYFEEKTKATLKSKQTSIATVRNHLRTLASSPTPLIFHWSLPLNTVGTVSVEGSGSGINSFGSGSGLIPKFSVKKSHFFNQIAQKIGIFSTYIYVHIKYVYIYVNAHIYVHIHTYTYTTHTHDIHTYVYIYMCVCIYICKCTHKCTHIHIHIYIHIHKHKYPHTYTHIYKQ
jgi:hypothetical protein